MKTFDPKVIENLTFATLSDPDTDASVFPDFFIAGPQRTGSTFLYGVLEKHPQVFMSNPKEIYYFNTLRDPKHPQRVTTDLKWYLDFFRETDEYRRKRQKQCQKDFGVDYAPKVRGEATASYAAGMRADNIEDLKALKPDLKVILSVRNPIERAWSHAKKDLGREKTRKVADIPQEEFIQFMSQPYQLRCGRYTEQIAFWGEHFGADNIFISIFDSIRDEPEKQCSRVMEFLEIDADPKFFPVVNEGRVNATEKTDGVPEPYRSMLAEEFAHEMKLLRERYGVEW